MSSSSFNFVQPPTLTSLADAQRKLEQRQASLCQVTAQIDAAEEAIAQLIAESRTTIDALEQERAALQNDIGLTLAYLSPMRRLPDELLREIFWFNFEAYPCCAWVLASVSTLWRKLALSMPRLWSKIRLVTNQKASADTIRLWLERSGSRIPLDVEIFLRVTLNTSSRGRTRSPSPSLWSSLPPPPVGSSYVQVGHSAQVAQALQALPPISPLISPTSPHSTWPLTSSVHSRSVVQHSSGALHWGHIALFYLVGQMHRWERFVFRFDKQFKSAEALKSINRPAPMLKEFEVSCAEPSFFNDWPWLPCADPANAAILPELRTLTLQYVPFKWSSPMLRTNLRSLTLRSLPTQHLPLDRILRIVASNPNLEELSLHFTAVQAAILPLTPTTLAELRDLSISGHYLLAQLVDSLIVPSLDSLTFDIELREPFEDCITNLLARSNKPPLTRLSLAYSSASFYYGGGTLGIPWTFLTDLDNLLALQVGGTPLDPLLSALSVDENQNQWLCPNLVQLSMRACHPQGDGVAKLVQMVDARNPPTGSSQTVQLGAIPAKLERLELHDCASIGQDVIAWLQTRVEEVVCSESAFDRSPSRSPYGSYLA